MRKLSPKYRIKRGFTFVVAAIVWMIFSLALGPTVEQAFRITSGTISNFALGAAAVFLIPYMLYVELKYRYFNFDIGERVIHVRKGIIRIAKFTIPYENIQSINIDEHILDRILGISTIKIETAASKTLESEIILPGVDDARNLMGEIMEKVEKYKHLSMKSEPVKENIMEHIEIKNKETKDHIDVKYNEMCKNLENLSIASSKITEHINILENKVNSFEKNSSLTADNKFDNITQDLKVLRFIVEDLSNRIEKIEMEIYVLKNHQKEIETKTIEHYY